MQFTLVEGSGSSTPIEVEVTKVYNFGYAGRNRDSVLEHVEELVEQGFRPPNKIPSIYRLPVSLASTAGEVVVLGDGNYGEVEFALINTTGGWLVAIASDHSDVDAEELSTARAKTAYADVMSQEVWSLDEVVGHWDQLELICERKDADGWETVQRGHLEELLAPDAILEELQRRTGAPVEVGTIILSGTVGGLIKPGAAAWKVSLRDPVLGRKLEAVYGIEVLDIEVE